MEVTLSFPNGSRWQVPYFDVIPSRCEESFPDVRFKKTSTEPLPLRLFILQISALALEW